MGVALWLAQRERVNATRSGSDSYVAAQRTSLGRSASEIHEAAIAAARPTAGLRWLDIGCGRGDALRVIWSRHEPAELAGVDVIDWLAPDLRDAVTLTVAPAEEAVLACDPADRVLLIECLDDLNAPWSVLRSAARLVRPGGELVVSVPNVASLRGRAEFALRGYPSSCRPMDPAQHTPVLPHVVKRVLREEGLAVPRATYALPEVIPLSGGRLWSKRLASRFSLLNASLVLAAQAPLADETLHRP